MDNKEEQLLTSLDESDALDEEKEIKSQLELTEEITEITITQLYNKLQRFGYYAVATKYIDLREIQQFNQYHIATSVNVTVKNNIIKSLDDILVIDTIQTCKLKEQLTSDTAIIFICSNNRKSIQSFLFNKFKIKKFMILQSNAFAQFVIKYPWIIRKGQEYKDTNEMLCSYPHEIIENKLFLGNYEQSNNVEIIANLKITHIINVTKETHTKKIKNISYYKVAIDDHEKENILKNDLLLHTILYIDKVLSENTKHKCFVHCHQGVSRSSTIVIAYLMYKYKWTLDKTQPFVEAIRPRIYPNNGFRKQLMQFEKQTMK